MSAAIAMFVSRQRALSTCISIFAIAINCVTGFPGVRLHHRPVITCPHLVHMKSRALCTSFASSVHQHQRQLNQIMHQSASSTAVFGSSSSSDSCISIRILCLHGKGGNGKQFINKSLIPLRRLVEKRFFRSA